MITQFNFPTVIRFGEGAVKEIGPHLSSEGYQKPLIVTDPNVAQLDFFKAIVNDLQTELSLAVVFSDIHANPVKSDVLAGGDAYEANDCDCIVGVGGGAGMDVARAIALRVNHKRDLFDYDDLIGGDKFVTENVPYFVTVPTTSGTGSEVGRSAIISENETKRKRILFSPKLLASRVFADPALTYGLPSHITAATGMDALTHNIEAFLAKGWNPMCDGLALEAITKICGALENATTQPTPESRADMMIGSLMGAIAFQKGLGIVHALAHPLSTLLDMHHGLANTLMITHGLRFNYPGNEDKFERLALAMGVEDGSQVVIRLEEMRKNLGMKPRLSDHGVKQENLEALADLAVADFCLPANPREASRDQLLEIYKEAL